MIRGKVALGGLSLEFGNAQKRFDELAARVRKLSDQQAQLVKRERALIEELARLYLPELSPTAVSSGLRELEERMFEALAEQRAVRERLDSELAALPQEIRRLETALEEAEWDEAQAAQRLEGAREKLEAHLAADEAYAVAVEEHTAVMERRALLKERRARLQAAANVERIRYEEYAPFAYLHARGYGGPDYRRGAIAAFFDGWLARRTGYAEMARNHRILRTGPHAIQAEIRRLTQRGTELEAQVDEMETGAAQACDFDGALDRESRAQEHVSAARAALEAARRRRDTLTAEAREVEANRGGPYETAIQVHRDFLEGQTVRELLRTARATPDPRDDALVDKVEAVRKELEGVDRELSAQRKELERMADRTGGLADLARSAAARFTTRRSHFPEEFRLGKLVRSILDGTMEAGEALETMAESHVAEPVLEPRARGPWGGWFAELSSQLDQELGATTLHRIDDVSVETEVVVRDAQGNIVQRRVTRRGGPAEG